MSTPQARSIATPDAASWHYRDARGVCGPYPAAGIARLYQFGHIRPDTPVWQDDPEQARPLRAWPEAFALEAGGRIRVIAPEPPPPEPPPAPVEPAPPPAPAMTHAAEPEPAPAPPATVPERSAAPAGRRRWLLPVLAALALLALAAAALRFAT